MCHRTTTFYLDHYGQRQTQNEVKLCPNANGRPCSLTTTGNLREVEERIPEMAIPKQNPPVDVHNGSSISNESKGKSKGSSFNAVGVTLGLRKPSFRLVNTKKEAKESDRSRRDKVYSSRDNYGLPTHLPSQIPPTAPDAPAPGTYYRLPTYPIPSPAGPPTLASPSVHTSIRSSDSGYVGQAHPVNPVSATSISRAVVLVEPTTSQPSQFTTPPRDNVRLVIPSSSSRPSTSTSRTSNSEIFSRPASVNSSQTYHSNVINPGLSRRHHASKGTNPHAYRDSALGTSVGTPSSPTTTTVGGITTVTESEDARSVRAYEDEGEREKRHRANTSSNHEGRTHRSDRRSHHRQNERSDESIIPPPPPPPPFNNSSANYYNSSHRHVEGTDRHHRDSSREPRPRRRRHNRHTSSSSSSQSPIAVFRSGPRGGGPSDSGNAAIVMSGALPVSTIERRRERKSPSRLGDMDETASTTERRTREARRRFREDETRSFMHN